MKNLTERPPPLEINLSVWLQHTVTINSSFSFETPKFHDDHLSTPEALVLLGSS